MRIPSLADKRRSVRSSNAFQAALGSILLLALAMTWHRVRASTSATNPLTRLWHRVTSTPPDMTSAATTAATTTTANGTMLPLRLVTYNVRNANTPRPFLAPGEEPWPVRLPRLAAQLDFLAAGHDGGGGTFFCLQECMGAQVEDLLRRLGPGWAHIGRGRDGDGDDKEGEHGTRSHGEFSPIFYRSEVWECTRAETRWLSETPARPSRGWDAALNRIVTVGEFAHRTKGVRVVVMSTHFDHVGRDARAHSARLLLDFAREWSGDDGGDGGGKGRVVLVGADLNSSPDEEDGDDNAYRIMVASGSGVVDIADRVPDDRRLGNRLTYTGFAEPDEWPQRIDFLFLWEPKAAMVQVRTFSVLSNSFDDGVRISDHRPVVADLEIPV